jgi:hypothetical protein
MIFEDHPHNLPPALEEAFGQTEFQYSSKGRNLPLDLIIEEADMITKLWSVFWDSIFGLHHEVLADDGLTYATCRSHCQSDSITQLIPN